jgi:hypothetical protein
VISSHRPLVTSLAIGVVAVLGVSACTSDPSPTRVAEDLVKTLTQDFPRSRSACSGVIDDYDLDKSRRGCEPATTPTSATQRSPSSLNFEADLAACDPEGVTRTSTP